MKTLMIIVAVILCFLIKSEILTLLGIIAGGVGFLGLIAKEAIEK